MLKREGYKNDILPIGKTLGDPKDFSNYIMFSKGNLASEIVVLSREYNQLLMDADLKYKPGKRMYFDGQAIASKGLLIRDGAHVKVKDKLPLEPYMIWSADCKELSVNGDFSTPREFTNLANRKFNSLYKRNLKTDY